MITATSYALRLTQPAGFGQLGASWTTPMGVAQIERAAVPDVRDTQPDYRDSAGVGDGGRS